ncbi:MAG: Reversal of tor2 lethality [Sclerophora amabilis]|nr:MAG: Reversal of tor2 lethality [Sclerophora amabilis]
MRSSLSAILFAGLYLISSTSAAGAADLTGTWSTKSRKVLTGPGFYDPVKEKLKEPSLTGISYSFTEDGFYEEAYYRAISNPTDPACPKGVMQFQHGKYTKAANGSLLLTPFGVDGRQLMSDPCKYDTSVYTRYTQFEMFKSYEVLTDPYHGTPRLNLYQFDGTPMNPMFLVYKPPQMLPTKTMNPTAAKTGSKSSTKTANSKRGLAEDDEITVPLNINAIKKRSEPIDADKWWWIGVGLSILGGVGYICF